MVRVMEGKIIEKWSERKQKLLQFRGKLIQVSVMFELARVRAVGMTRRFDLICTIGTKYYRPHKVSLLHLP